MASPHSSVISSTIINLPFNIIYQHAGLSLQIEFAFIPEGGESGTCACSDKDNVSRQILVMEACIWSHRFVLDPCAIAFILSTKQVFSLMPAFYHFTYQSVRPTVQHQFLRFVSSSELSFQSCPIDCGLPQSKLLILLYSVRHGIGLIKMLHNPLDNIAQPYTVGHTRESKLITFVSFLVCDTHPAKQTVHTQNKDTCYLGTQPLKQILDSPYNEHNKVIKHKISLLSTSILQKSGTAIVRYCSEDTDCFLLEAQGPTSVLKNTQGKRRYSLFFSVFHKLARERNLSNFLYL